MPEVKTNKNKSKNTNTNMNIKGAKKSGSRSGYAKDVAPERLDASDSVAVPVAGGRGRQAGRPAPGDRKYGVRYEAVSAQEAQMNMIKRARGELEPIKGGLDDNMTTVDRDKDNKRSARDLADADFDPLSGSPEPGAEDLIAEERRLVNLGRQGIKTASEAEPVVSKDNAYDKYVSKRMRVTLDLNDGSMNVSAIDVKQSKYGLTILLPLLDEGATFIPKPGSEITVSYNDARIKCFFPGTYFELPELKMLGLVFVRADEQ